MSPGRSTDGDRVGLCGPNGAGKTTLLRMLAGLEEPDGGRILKPSGLTVGYLPQDGLTTQAARSFEEASSAFQPLLDMQAEMHASSTRWRTRPSRMANTRPCSSGTATCRIASGSRTATASTCRDATVLQGLGFSEADFDARPRRSPAAGRCASRSPSCCWAGPNLLLLDEPTNHLDLDARNWLEEYLTAYPHAVILVSHDRFFLDAVVTRIAEITLRTLTDYVGNYSNYLWSTTRASNSCARPSTSRTRKSRACALFIDRFRYQATKASQVQSRIKMLDKIVPIEVPPERKRIHFTFPDVPEERAHGPRTDDVRKAYGANVVFGGINLHIERGDRIALVGTQRRRQVHADAHALGRGSARLRRAPRGPPGRHAVLRAGRGHPSGPDAHGVRDARSRLADAAWCR